MKNKILLFTTMLMMWHGAFALNLGQIKTNIRVLIKDSATTRQRYSDTQLLAMINEAQRDVINSTLYISTQTSFVTVSGTTYYAMPTNYIQVERLTYSGRNLNEGSLISQDGQFNNAAWETTGGLPQVYFQRNSKFGQLGFYPFPNSASSTGTVLVDYFCYATDLSADSDIPYNGDTYSVPYHDLLVFYPTYRVYLIEGNTDRATFYRQEYESRLLIMQQNSTAKPNFLPRLSGPSSSRPSK